MNSVAEELEVTEEPSPHTARPRGLHGYARDMWQLSTNRLYRILVGVTWVIIYGILGGLVFVAGFHLLPDVLVPLQEGPLRQWIEVAGWLWYHGEVSLPLGVFLVSVLAVPAVRRRTGQIMAEILARTFVALLVLGAAGGLLMVIWKMVERLP